MFWMNLEQEDSSSKYLHRFRQCLNGYNYLDGVVRKNAIGRSRYEVDDADLSIIAIGFLFPEPVDDESYKWESSSLLFALVRVRIDTYRYDTISAF